MAKGGKEAQVLKLSAELEGMIERWAVVNQQHPNVCVPVIQMIQSGEPVRYHLWLNFVAKGKLKPGAIQIISEAEIDLHNIQPFEAHY